MDKGELRRAIEDGESTDPTEEGELRGGRRRRSAPEAGVGGGGLSRAVLSVRPRSHGPYGDSDRLRIFPHRPRRGVPANRWELLPTSR